ncbi:hypothetical protein EJD97_019628 [Solanum chilense]|uniref:TF-B3 domain-containing protein n=1 Tax=Solanum chilense TaxID=4083 RepID=A0A6N2AYP5_SOLCI|nr:hypothetical protein EJD97_019628 [Solanum chilense]
MESPCISGSKLKGVVGEHSGQCTEITHKELFRKVLTSTDVGSFSRLVIPKKYATKYFSQIQDEEMVFIYDTSGTLWKFKYHYCESSQSFLFTTGWLNFVKDKGLKAKDTIVFNLCESMNGTKVNNCNTFVIDVTKNIEVLPMDQQEEIIDQDAAANLVPVYLFGKQIGWTETKKGNGV